MSDCVQRFCLNCVRLDKLPHISNFSFLNCKVEIILPIKWGSCQAYLINSSSSKTNVFDCLQMFLMC